MTASKRPPTKNDQTVYTHPAAVPNPYLYAAGDPLNNIDPTGEGPVTDRIAQVACTIALSLGPHFGGVLNPNAANPYCEFISKMVDVGDEYIKMKKENIDTMVELDEGDLEADEVLGG